MLKKLHKLVCFRRACIATVALLTMAGCGNKLASNPVDLTAVSRLSCNSDDTVPSAWETGGVIISLNQPDSAFLLMSEKTFTFVGQYQATPTSLTMTFPGGADASGNVSLLRSPMVKAIESFQVIGHDKDGRPTIETSGFKLKCIVEKRIAVNTVATADRAPAAPNIPALVDPITEEFIAKVGPEASTEGQPEARATPQSTEASTPSASASSAAAPSANAKQVPPPETAIEPAFASRSEAGAYRSSTSADKESSNEPSSNESVLTEFASRIALLSYNPRLRFGAVKRGQPIYIDSNAGFANSHQDAINDVREELTVYGTNGTPFKSGSKPMAGNQGKTYENSFTLILPQTAPQGVYYLKTKLYANGRLLATRNFSVLLE